MDKPLNRDFLLSRGKCCGSGCRNCPYFPKASKGATRVFDIPDSVDCFHPFICSIGKMKDGRCNCANEFNNY